MEGMVLGIAGGLLVFLKLSFGYAADAVSLNGISVFLYLVLSLIGAAIIVIVQPYREEHEVFNVISANVFLFHGLLFASC